MKLAIVCNECNTYTEINNEDFHSTISLYEFSNTNLDVEFEGEIDGFEEDGCDESDLSIENPKLKIRCKKCNSSLEIEG